MAKSSIGIDIGSSTIKMVRVERRRLSNVITHFAKVTTPADCIRDTKVVNEQLLSETLRKLREELNISANRVVLGLTSPEIVVKRVSFPAMSMKELTKAMEYELSNIVHFPFQSINEVVFSLEELNRGSKEFDILVVACLRSYIDPFISVLRRARLDPHVIDLTSFALPRVYGRGKRICYVNIGAGQTSVYVELEGVYSVYRILPFGGRLMTTSISDAFGMSFEQAEELKKRQDINDLILEDSAARIGITNTVEQFANSIVQTLDFVRAGLRKASINQVVDQVVISGGAALQKGLIDLLREEVNLDVKLLRPFHEVPVVDKRALAIEDDTVYSCATGLALRGLS